MGATKRLDTPYIACHTVNMPHGESQTFSEARVRLDLEPSPRLSDALSLFLNDSTESDVNNTLTIRSLGGFGVNLFGESALIRPLPYHIEPHGEPTIESKIRNFENNYLKKISGVPIPLAAYSKTEYNPRGSTRIMMRLLPLDNQKNVFSEFAKFLEGPIDTTDPGEFVVIRIPRTRVNLARGAIMSAQGELNKLIIPSDKVKDTSDYRQRYMSVHDDDVFLSLRPRLSISPVPSLAIDNRHNEPSIA